MKDPLPAAAGLLALLAVWEAIGRLTGTDGALAPPSAILALWALPEQRRLLADALACTGGETLAGLAIGTLIGTAGAALGRLVPSSAPGLTALAGLVNGIPIIAVAGVCVLTVPRGLTPIVVAALASAFIVFVGTLAGFAATSTEQRALFVVLGASRGQTFARLELPTALPHLLDAVRAAAPVTVVGAILGEWFAAERGLGPMLIAALQNYHTAAMWSTALAGCLLSIALYAVFGMAAALLERARA